MKIWHLLHTEVGVCGLVFCCCESYLISTSFTKSSSQNRKVEVTVSSLPTSIYDALSFSLSELLLPIHVLPGCPGGVNKGAYLCSSTYVLSALLFSERSSKQGKKSANSILMWIYAYMENMDLVVCSYSMSLYVSPQGAWLDPRQENCLFVLLQPLISKPALPL